MKYRITIEEVIEVEDKEYPKENVIYEQIVQKLPIEKIIILVNSEENL